MPLYQRSLALHGVKDLNEAGRVLHGLTPTLFRQALERANASMR